MVAHLYPFSVKEGGVNNGAWRSGLARMVRDHEVVGSNPTAPSYREQGLGNRKQGKNKDYRNILLLEIDGAHTPNRREQDT